MREKRLAPGEARFVAKRRGEGKGATWGVYDRQRACWPVMGGSIGVVKQGFATEAEAQAEADRIAKIVSS